MSAVSRLISHWRPASPDRQTSAVFGDWYQAEETFHATLPFPVDLTPTALTR